VAPAFDEHHISKAAFIVALSAGLGYMFDAYVVNMFSFVLPLIKADYKASVTTLGWVASILLAGYMIGTFLFGYLADKWGRKPTLNLSIVTYALTNAAAGAMPGVASFAAMRFMTGIGGAGEIAVGVPYTCEVYPTRKRAFGCGGLIFSLYAVGALMGLGIALGFAQQVGWRWTFYLSLVPAAFVLLLRRRLTESERFRQAKKEHDAESVQEGGFARGQVGEIFHTPELRRRLIIASMIFTANAVGYWGFLVFLQTYMLKTFHLTFRHSLAITMIFFGAMFFWPWIAAAMAERIGRRPTGVIGGIGLAAGSIIGFSNALAGRVHRRAGVRHRDAGVHVVGRPHLRRGAVSDPGARHGVRPERRHRASPGDCRTGPDRHPHRQPRPGDDCEDLRGPVAAIYHRVHHRPGDQGPAARGDLARCPATPSRRARRLGRGARGWIEMPGRVSVAHARGTRRERPRVAARCGTPHRA